MNATRSPSAMVGPGTLHSVLGRNPFDALVTWCDRYALLTVDRPNEYGYARVRSRGDDPVVLRVKVYECNRSCPVRFGPDHYKPTRWMLHIKPRPFRVRVGQW